MGKTVKKDLHQTRLMAGMPAPWFEGIDQNGLMVNPASFPGKELLLYFYPKDNTPPCTNQACSLRDHYTELSGKNYAIVGVSADNELSHAAFAAQHQLPFSLLADVDLAIIKAYDVWGLKDIAGRVFEGIVRTTFIISSDGVIKRVLTHPKTAGHAQEVLSLKT